MVPATALERGRCSRGSARTSWHGGRLDALPRLRGRGGRLPRGRRRARAMFVIVDGLVHAARRPARGARAAVAVDLRRGPSGRQAAPGRRGGRQCADHRRAPLGHRQGRGGHRRARARTRKTFARSSAKSPQVLVNLTRILSGQLADTTRLHAQRGHRGEAVALVVGPVARGRDRRDVVAATAAASAAARCARSTPASRSGRRSTGSTRRCCEHGTVVLVARAGPARAAALLAEHVDRAVALVGDGRGGAARGAWPTSRRAWSVAARSRGCGAERRCRCAGGGLGRAGDRRATPGGLPPTTSPGSAATSRAPSSAWRSAPAAPRATRTSARCRSSRRPATRSTSSRRQHRRDRRHLRRPRHGRRRDRARPCARRSLPSGRGDVQDLALGPVDRAPSAMTADASGRPPASAPSTTPRSRWRCMAADLTARSPAPLREGPLWEALLARDRARRDVPAVRARRSPAGRRPGARSRAHRRADRGRRGRHRLRQPDPSRDACGVAGPGTSPAGARAQPRLADAGYAARGDGPVAARHERAPRGAGRRRGHPALRAGQLAGLPARRSLPRGRTGGGREQRCRNSGRSRGRRPQVAS